MQLVMEGGSSVGDGDDMENEEVDYGIVDEEQ